MAHKFNPEHLEKLRDPGRLVDLNPEIMWQKLDLAQTEVLVDVGAGVGIFAEQFADRMENGKIYACDIAPQMIDFMNNQLGAEYKQKIIPLQTGEWAIDLPNATADLVYAICLYHELADTNRSLGEFDRLLKPGAKLMVVDWKKRSTPHGPPVTHRVAATETKAQVEAAGFLGVTSYDDLPHHWMLVAQKA